MSTYELPPHEIAEAKKYHAHLLEQRTATKLDTAKLEARVRETEKDISRLGVDFSIAEDKRSRDRMRDFTPARVVAPVWPGVVAVSALIVAFIALVLALVS